jgi:hypothetical protein
MPVRVYRAEVPTSKYPITRAFQPTIRVYSRDGRLRRSPWGRLPPVTAEPRVATSSLLFQDHEPGRD